MRRAYLVPALALVLAQAVGASAQTYERPANPLRMQGGGTLGVVFAEQAVATSTAGGVGVFQTRGGRELVIARLPVDAFKRAGQRNSLLVQVATPPAPRTTPPGPRVWQLTYVALLPELDH